MKSNHAVAPERPLRGGILDAIIGLFYGDLYFLYQYRLAAMRTGVILLVIAAIVGWGWLTAKNNGVITILLAGVLGLIVGVVFFLKGRYEHGILALIPVAALMNFVSLPTGTQSRIPLSLVVALGLMALWLLQLLFVRKERRPLVPAFINAPLLFFVCESYLSYIWSSIFRDPLVYVPKSFVVVQIAALIVNTFLPLTALFVGNVIKEIRWLKYLAWGIVGAGGLISAIILTHIPLENLFSSGNRGLFATWVCALAFALLLFKGDLRWGTKWLLGIIVLFWVYINFGLGYSWFSGWLPLFVALLVIIFMRDKRLFAGVLLVGAILAALNSSWIYQHLYVDQINDGDAGRLDLWKTNLELVAKHPLLGVGPAGYAVYYMTYNPIDARSTHNNYFDILAQTGILGSVFFVWLLESFFWTGFKLLNSLRGRRDFEEAFGVAAFAGLCGVVVAMFLGDWVLPFAYNQTISGFDNAVFTWMMLGAMVALEAMVKKKQV